MMQHENEGFTIHCDFKQNILVGHLWQSITNLVQCCILNDKLLHDLLNIVCFTSGIF